MAGAARCEATSAGRSSSAPVREAASLQNSASATKGIINTFYPVAIGITQRSFLLGRSMSRQLQ